LSNEIAGRLKLAKYWVPVPQGSLVPGGGDLSQETFPNPGHGDDQGALPLHLCDDRVPAPPETAGDRRNGDRPGEEGDPEPDPEVDVLPLPASQGTPVPGGRDGDGACHVYDPGIAENTQIAGEGV